MGELIGPPKRDFDQPKIHERRSSNPLSLEDLGAGEAFYVSAEAGIDRAESYCYNVVSIVPLSTEPAPHSPQPVRLAIVFRFFCGIMAVTIIGVVILSRLFYKELGLSRGFEFDKIALLLLASGFISLGLLLRRLKPELALLGVSLLTGIAMLMVGALVMRVDLAGMVKESVLSLVVRERKPNIYAPDERYGYRLRPSARDVARSFDFEVVYAIDDQGYRVTPTPPSRKGTVVIVGCSYTFGDGVEDDATYPYLLGSKYWPDFKVINAAVSGWGPAQVYLRIEEILAKEPEPRLIVYAMIPDHQHRSHFRLPVTEGVQRRLEYVDDRFVLIDRKVKTSEPDAGWVEKEIQWNISLILGMARLCREKGVMMAIVLLQDFGRYHPDLIYALGKSAIPVLDLTRLTYERFTHDSHPNPADHRRIAQALHSSVLTAMLYGSETGAPK